MLALCPTEFRSAKGFVFHFLIYSLAVVFAQGYNISNLLVTSLLGSDFDIHLPSQLEYLVRYPKFTLLK